MESYKVNLINLNSKDELSVQVLVDEAETTEDIVIRLIIKEQEFTASNYSYLPAYQEIRDKLLVAGYGIKCNGSRLNGVQSGMLGTTDKVYLVVMGKQALMKDVVHIWDYAEIDTFPNTKQQNAFFEQWLKTLNSNL